MQQQKRRGSNENSNSYPKSRNNNLSGAAGQRATNSSDQNAVTRSSVKPSINKKKHQKSRNNNWQDRVSSKESYNFKAPTHQEAMDKPDQRSKPNNSMNAEYEHHIIALNGKEKIIHKVLAGILYESDTGFAIRSNYFPMSEPEQLFPMKVFRKNNITETIFFLLEPTNIVLKFSRTTQGIFIGTLKPLLHWTESKIVEKRKKLVLEELKEKAILKSSKYQEPSFNIAESYTHDVEVVENYYADNWNVIIENCIRKQKIVVKMQTEQTIQKKKLVLAEICNLGLSIQQHSIVEEGSISNLSKVSELAVQLDSSVNNISDISSSKSKTKKRKKNTQVSNNTNVTTSYSNVLPLQLGVYPTIEDDPNHKNVNHESRVVANTLKDPGISYINAESYGNNNATYQINLTTIISKLGVQLGVYYQYPRSSNNVILGHRSVVSTVKDPGKVFNLYYMY